MPEFRIVKNTTKKEASEILRLYREPGWWTEEISHEALERLVRGSYFFSIVVEGDEIVGMGRVISDGVSDAYIQDVAVRKDSRNRGIGSLIIKRLCERLLDAGIDWIGLIAEKGSHPFYENLNFVQMPESVPMLHRKTYQMMGFDKTNGGNK